MKALSLALAGVMMLCALMPASAKTIITEDNGGVVVNYIKKYSDMRDSGEKVVVDGPCISSCTLLLGILRSENFCATDKAVFGFHSASLKTEEPGKKPVYTHAPEMSALLFNVYPGKVRALLNRRGWMGQNPSNGHPDIIWVSGKSLSLIARRCTPDDLT